jgi:poly-gamma-glutamate capsule biosynthesis protein CapA/YwtB (metallophosphatase superfamily)
MAKEEAKREDDVATIQLDWSENYNLKQAREEKGTRVK